MFWICGDGHETFTHSLDPSEEPGEDAFFYDEPGSPVEQRDWAGRDAGIQEPFGIRWESGSDQCRCVLDGGEMDGEVETWDDSDAGGFSWRSKGEFCRCRFKCHPT